MPSNQYKIVPMVHDEKLREDFSVRLAQACSDAGIEEHGRGVILAKRLGVTPKAVSKWLNSESMPRQGKMKELAKVLNVSTSWLQYGEPDNGVENVTHLDIQPSHKGDFPVLGKVSAGKFKEAVQHFDLEYLSTTVKCHPDSYWLIVDGHSMTAPQGSGVSFLEGMLILVDPEREYCNGNFVVAYCENKHMATFKKISIEPEGTFLVPLNPDPTYKRINIAEEFCEIAGVVVDARWKLF
ncbi:helix-turn-helix domain-containing protein [Vibrio alginolyticus]|uniref:S24 family peptidase n=1 Tax=Vibrio alginolyticus TaxID=663 RepID=UPI001EEEBB9E|nr:S24 family peptidase [Vibrio alginolyticus]EGR0803300.1 helix-turn-helix domain-containing protein [Vibrio alginolyticus]MCS0201673.1 helix-turn-helix domain-containing protein [Vibrio alginolyticus]ULF97465.1 helix-turn-helix domain-containing protein [Vibrio alginolyticus]